MKVTSFVFLASMALFSSATAAPAPVDVDLALLHDACYAENGPCTQLDAAIAAARGILANPFPGEHDTHSKRAEEYLTSALGAAEKRAPLEKRDPLPRRNNWCGWVGQACWKVKRSAEVVKDILGRDEFKSGA